MTSTVPFRAHENAVLQTLLYFELFDYPLTTEEVFHFCPEKTLRLNDVASTIQYLVNQGVVFQNNFFFQTKKAPEWVAQRLERNHRAQQTMPLAKRMAALIYAFPFIQGVFVSGSLSKQSMRHDSDIDFFVVTTPGRLWLARTLLMLFKKTVLLNSHKYFCVNYFIDTEHLEIEEKNLYTAMETVTLIPMCGKEVYQQFKQANAWAWAMYPHVLPRETDLVPPKNNSRLKKLLEKFLSGWLGNWLDQKTMHITTKYWARKFKHLDQKTFDTALKSERHVSKHHPLYFQGKVLQALEARLKTLGDQISANP